LLVVEEEAITTVEEEVVEVLSGIPLIPLYLLPYTILQLVMALFNQLQYQRMEGTLPLMIMLKVVVLN